MITAKARTKRKPAAKSAKIPAAKGAKTPAVRKEKTSAARSVKTPATGTKKRKISDSLDDDPFGDVEAARQAMMRQRQNRPLVDDEEDPFGDIAAARKEGSQPVVMSAQVAEDDPFGDEAAYQTIRKHKAKVRFAEQEQSPPRHRKRRLPPESPTSMHDSSPPAGSPEPPNALARLIQPPVQPFCRVHISMDGQSTSSCSGNCLDPEVRVYGYPTEIYLKKQRQGYISKAYGHSYLTKGYASHPRTIRSCGRCLYSRRGAAIGAGECLSR